MPPERHPEFYNQLRFALNVTRADMVVAGWSPSVRLFEAAACGVPIISDAWPGLEELLTPGREILIAESTDEVVRYLREIGAQERTAIAAAARARVLAGHTAADRAGELEREVLAVGVGRAAPRGGAPEVAAGADRRAIAELGPWFHNLHLPDGLETCPDHWAGDFPRWKWQEFESAPAA